MAMSSCPKCQGHTFDLVTAEPRGSNYKQNFIQCSQCGTVVGVTDFYDSGVQLRVQDQKIETIQSSLKKLERAVGQIAHVVEQIAQRVSR